MTRPRLDRQWLRRRYVDDQAPVAVVAAEAGCDASTVWRALRTHDIPLRGRAGQETWGDVLTADYLRAALRDRLSISAIAREVGCHTRTVHEHLARHGLRETMSPAERRRVKRLYESEGLTVPQIAAVLDVGVRTTRMRLLEAGVALRRPGRRG